jgi:hypothetical protein
MAWGVAGGEGAGKMARGEGAKGGEEEKVIESELRRVWMLRLRTRRMISWGDCGRGMRMGEG